jgi:DUF971 family protein
VIGGLAKGATSDTVGSERWPTEIRLKKDEKILEIDFDDGSSFALPAELLRVESPSAEVQGHSPSEKKIVSGRRHVGIISVEPVGHYAICIHFDDMHETGIFTWTYLHQLGANREIVWQTYLQALEQRGLSRDP